MKNLEAVLAAFWVGAACTAAFLWTRSLWNPAFLIFAGLGLVTVGVILARLPRSGQR